MIAYLLFLIQISNLAFYFDCLFQWFYSTSSSRWLLKDTSDGVTGFVCNPLQQSRTNITWGLVFAGHETKKLQ